MLMNMIIDESRARRQLQQFVVQLQHELTDSKAEISVLKADVATYNLDSKKLDLLYNQTEGIRIETEMLKKKLSALLQKYKASQIESQNSKQEIQNLQHPKVVCHCVSFISATAYQNNTDNLSKDMGIINLKINQLISDGNARKKEFLALYNKTLISDRKVTELGVNIGRYLTILMTMKSISSTDIYSLNKTYNKLKDDIVQLKEKQHLKELKMSFVESEINSTMENIAVTSRVSDSTTYYSGDIIKYSDMKLLNGIGNVENFKSSWKFTCEKPGLYLFWVCIMSPSTYAKYDIFKNGIVVSRVYVRPTLTSTGDSSKYHTGTGIIAVQLNANDTLNIKTRINMQVHGSDYSCLTIINVK